MASMEYTGSLPKYKRILNIATILILASAAAFVLFGMRHGIFTSQEAMTKFLQPFGLLTPVVYTLFIVFQSTFMVVPGAVGNLVGIILFGPFWGIIYNYVGSVLGSSLNFALARLYGPDVIRLITPKNAFRKYEKWLEADEKRFHKWFTICIFLPVAPDDIACYFAGLTRMTYRKFIIIILLGKPLGVITYSLLLHAGFTNLLRLFIR